MPLSTGLKLPKSGRLHHRSLQERLFTEGSKLHEYPLKLVWNSLTLDELGKNFRDRIPDLIGPVQILVSVPKKKRRKAVDRVLMRRRIREAFRLNRGPLIETVDAIPELRTLSVGIVYMKEANAPYAVVEEKIRALVARLAEKVSEKYRKEDDDSEKDNISAADTAD